MIPEASQVGIVLLVEALVARIAETEDFGVMRFSDGAITLRIDNGQDGPSRLTVELRLDYETLERVAAQGKDGAAELVDDLLDRLRRARS